jgi:hypothetical protein
MLPDVNFWADHNRTSLFPSAGCGMQHKLDTEEQGTLQKALEMLDLCERRSWHSSQIAFPQGTQRFMI